MSEFVFQDEMSVYSWICCYIPKKHRDNAVEICKQKGIRETAILARNSWDALESELKEHLSIKTIQNWIASNYVPVEHLQVASYVTDTKELPLNLEIDKDEWKEIQKNYEKTTCK